MIKTKIIISIVMLLAVAGLFVTAGSFGPEDNRIIGYEYLDSNGNVVNETVADVIHTWNTKYDFYYNKTSGIQFTNNFEEYWNRNVFCGGYKNAQGNWVYECNDALPFSWSIDTDNQTYVNYTGFKDVSIGNKEVRAAIRYHLKTNDENLTVQFSIKNIGNSSIDNDLGFAWIAKDIGIAGDEIDDKILINDTDYWLNDSLDLTFRNMDKSFYKLYDLSGADIKLWWDNSINYGVEVKSAGGQYNAPVTLGINVGSLTQGQEKKTEMFWIDAPTPEPTWDTGYFNYTIWTDDTSLTWNAGTKICEANLTNNNSQTVSCINGGIIPNTSYRVQAVLKSKDGSLSNLNIQGDKYVWNRNVNGSNFWAGSDAILGSCAFEDFDLDDGDTNCSISFDRYCSQSCLNDRSDVRIENNGSGNVVIAKNGSMEGFMYNITVSGNVVSSNASYMFFEYGSSRVDEDSSRIDIVIDYANESEGDEAIEEGINNSLPDNPIETDQQVYLFDGAVHGLGSFDKLTEQGNQTWVFNYVTSGESFENMPSLFDVLNVWENESLTYSQIVGQVQDFVAS